MSLATGTTPGTSRALTSTSCLSTAGRRPRPPPPPPSLPGDLTEREREVAALVARGCSNQEIADQLVISHKTVKTHISNILGKLNLQDRTQLAIFALQHGLGEQK